ncbi:unnamed protein product [Amoebophrya sp. A120]|nr:unnamed protein product [Amoebophrya sp. A120]|eukprot:GSA120T00013750001.1
MSVEGSVFGGRFASQPAPRATTSQQQPLILNPPTQVGTAAGQPGAGQQFVQQPGLTSLYDRQYITLHNLLEREMRQRVESEKMIRDDMTSMQEGLARCTNQIHEVSTDLRGNLPRLYQECKELRQDCKALTQAFNAHSMELAKLNEIIAENKSETLMRFEKNEQKAEERLMYDRQEKTDQWAKLCTKQVVQELADKVGCMDMEAHAKFLERKQEYEEAIQQVKSMEEKVNKSLEEFLRGINKCDYLYSQCNQSNNEFQKACSEVTEQHRNMIDDIVFPRIERCEALLNQEMCERVDCLKKIAHELVHSKEQNDRVKDQVERLAVDLSTSQAARMGMDAGSAMMSPGNMGGGNNMQGTTNGALLDRSSARITQAQGQQFLTPRQSPMLRPSVGAATAGAQMGSVVIGGKIYPPGTRVVQQ